MKSKLSLPALLAAAALTTIAANGWAHSFPEEQHPSAGQTLAAPPQEVTIKFDAPIEKLFSKVQVLDAAGKDYALGIPSLSPDGVTLSTRLAALKPGEYTVKWSALCVDTHHTEGSYSFTVSGSGS